MQPQPLYKRCPFLSLLSVPTAQVFTAMCFGGAGSSTVLGWAALDLGVLCWMLYKHRLKSTGGLILHLSFYPLIMLCTRPSVTGDTQPFVPCSSISALIVIPPPSLGMPTHATDTLAFLWGHATCCCQHTFPWLPPALLHNAQP